MLNNLPLRKKFTVVLAAPLLAGALVAIIGLALGDSVIRVASGIGLLVILVAAWLASTTLRDAFERIQHVSDAADELATKRLPMLVESTDGESVTFQDFPGKSEDNLGRIIGALNAVQDKTSGLAGKQHEEIREGLSELVVNLVRRNQSLLDRQIEHIDQLEAGEEDPDRLESLFGVDHLATRMRRNAESLMVLAGTEPPRRKGEPISINDLMRVAMSEIEGYQNIHLTRVDEGMVGAQAAFDIAHLLSELLENATQFSPPNSQVEMAGSGQSDGSYLISIADHGIGMSDEQVTETNRLLANPPELNLNLGRSLGFIVVARLAQRLSMTVELAQTPGGAGVTALILIPDALFNTTADEAPATDSGSVAPTLAGQPAPSLAGQPAPSLAGQPAPAVESPAPAPAPSSPFAMPTLDAEPAWTPPSLPERGSGGLGQREGVEEPAAPVQSEALARLLGNAPPASPAPAAPTPTAPAAPTAPSQTPATAAPTETPAEAVPAFELPTREIGASGAGTDEPDLSTPVGEEPQATPQKLEEALPTGETFDAGVASLLDETAAPAGLAEGGVPTPESSAPAPTHNQAPPSGPVTGEQPAVAAATTATGLVKRDRSRSQAPIGEGRVIPDQGRAATASSRDPEEIRNMLARYRKAREGNSPTAPSPETSTESGDKS